MEHVIVAHADRPAHAGAVIRWAEREASLRGLPLRVVRDSRSEIPDGATLLVVGTPDADVGDFACPVVFVPTVPRPENPLAEVALAVNAREPAEAAVDFAFDTARVRGVRLRAVHAWRFPSCAAELPFGIPEEDRQAWEDHEVQLLADVLRPWREKYPQVPVLEDVRLLPPAQALVQRSASAGLVVMGRRPGGAPGAVTRVLLRESLCPVAIVPA
ncbi:universal stress protein [Streptomyces sviceus]|uniref:universal stress protein n=1 Tax=Streptomyces sviceus TaxID=285530 RepID=UPI00382C82E4